MRLASAGNQNARRPRADRFWRHVQKNEGCWLWTGPHDRRGYGRFSEWQPGTGTIKSRFAHRVAYELARGVALSQEQILRHQCDNPPCVRPDHLHVGTHADNVADMVRKGRQQRGEEHWSAKLTSDDVARLRRLRRDGASLRDLSREFGLSPSTVQRIVTRKAWAHVAERGELPR